MSVTPLTNKNQQTVALQQTHIATNNGFLESLHQTHLGSQQILVTGGSAVSAVGESCMCPSYCIV